MGFNFTSHLVLSEAWLPDEDVNRGCDDLARQLMLRSLSPLSPHSRRAVTEHQLMHDRGRNIQSLKRLIWLSSAIEGLHTAQTRSAAFNPTKVLNLDLNPALVSAAGSPQSARVQSLLRDFFNPYLTQLPDREP